MKESHDIVDIGVNLAHRLFSINLHLPAVARPAPRPGMPPNTTGDMGKRKSRPGARQRSAPLGEGVARKGQKIYACLRVKGKLTWRNTGTIKLAQARKWREKWASKQGNETDGIASKGLHSMD